MGISGNTLGDNLGNAIGEAVADSNNIMNQPAKTISQPGPDNKTFTVDIPENKMRDNLIKEWELIGRKIIEFLTNADRGSSEGLVLKLSSGEALTIKSGEISLKIGSNSIKVDASGITITGTTINLN